MAPEGLFNQYYQGNVATGNARVQYGNITHNHYSGPTELDQQRQTLANQINHISSTRDAIRDIIPWLNAADSSFTQHEAHKKHEPGTGKWFLNGRRYSEWLRGDPRLLWLHGKPGCCKTTLCSMIIEDIQRHVKEDEDIGFAYFYFSFRDVAKQTYQSWIFAVIAQLLYPALHKANEILKILHEQGQKLEGRNVDDGPDPGISTQPNEGLDIASIVDDLGFARARNQRHPKDLHPLLLRLLCCKKTGFLVIDGLDESPENGDLRSEVMDGLKGIMDESKHIKMLITSRREGDIEAFMKNPCGSSVAIEVRTVNEDIMRYVSKEMERHPKLSTLPTSTKDEIKCMLTEKADGMFRWVVCQLDQIKALKLMTPKYVSKALQGLPATLDETYERILAQYDGVEEVNIAMQWLAFSVRPLMLQELQEACLVTPVSEPYVQKDSRSAVESMLLGMTSLIQTQRRGVTSYEVTLAHYSVKEYLTSSRIQQSSVASLYLSERLCHEAIAQSCIAYIIHALTTSKHDDRCASPDVDSLGIGGSNRFLSRASSGRKPSQEYAGKWSTFPLLTYSLRWFEHQRDFESSGSINSAKSLQFLLFNNPSTARFLQHTAADRSLPLMMDPDCEIVRLFKRGDSFYYNNLNPEIARASSVPGFGLVLASHEGLIKTVEHLISSPTLGPTSADDMGLAFVAASHGGQKDVVSRLITSGAEIDFALGDTGTALGEAASMGHIDVVRLLLEHSANVDLSSGYGLTARSRGTPLQRASFQGHVDIVQLLLSHEADPNLALAPGTPLQLAAENGSHEIVRALLRAGAKPDLLGMAYGGTAIQLAARHMHSQCIKLLVESGGDPDKVEDGTTPAIYRAILSISVNSVKALIDGGVALGRGQIPSVHITPLHAAIRRSDLKMVRLLLNAHAPVNEVTGPENILDLALNLNQPIDIIESILQAGFEVGRKSSPTIVSSAAQAGILTQYKVRNLYQILAEAALFDHQAPKEDFNSCHVHGLRLNVWIRKSRRARPKTRGGLPSPEERTKLIISRKRGTKSRLAYRGDKQIINWSRAVSDQMEYPTTYNNGSCWLFLRWTDGLGERILPDDWVIDGHSSSIPLSFLSEIPRVFLEVGFDHDGDDSDDDSSESSSTSSASACSDPTSFFCQDHTIGPYFTVPPSPRRRRSFDQFREEHHRYDPDDPLSRFRQTYRPGASSPPSNSAIRAWNEEPPTGDKVPRRKRVVRFASEWETDDDDDDCKSSPEWETDDEYESSGEREIDDKGMDGP